MDAPTKVERPPQPDRGGFRGGYGLDRSGRPRTASDHYRTGSTAVLPAGRGAPAADELGPAAARRVAAVRRGDRAAPGDAAAQPAPERVSPSGLDVDCGRR